MTDPKDLAREYAEGFVAVLTLHIPQGHVRDELTKAFASVYQTGYEAGFAAGERVGEIEGEKIGLKVAIAACELIWEERCGDARDVAEHLNVRLSDQGGA